MASEDQLVFNVVWTGPGFTYLRYFVASQIRQSSAQFRFLANDCPPDQIAMMEEFASRHPQVIEVLNVSSDVMITHGAALDYVRNVRDDGELFAFIDPDIKASAPFVGAFLDALDDGCAAVTSGRGVWCESDVQPEGHPGVAGEHFYSQDGFVFGSPHFAIYRQDALQRTADHWGIGFRHGGPEFDDRVRAGLAAAGQEYWVYDTAKVVNILFQSDGNKLCHFEHPALLHVGGMSHYLSTPKHIRAVEARFEVARYSADVLRDLSEGLPAPPVPTGVDPSLTGRLQLVREELVDLVGTYAAFVQGPDD